MGKESLAALATRQKERRTTSEMAVRRPSRDEAVEGNTAVPAFLAEKSGPTLFRDGPLQ